MRRKYANGTLGFFVVPCVGIFIDLLGNRITLSEYYDSIERRNPTDQKFLQWCFAELGSSSPCAS